MEENKHMQIDAFLKEQLQEIPLESPSKDFTSNIMGVIANEELSVITKYKPLISKKVWLLVAAVLIGIFFIPFQKEEGSLLEKLPIDFSFLDKINLQSIRISGIFENLSVSTTTFYALLLFSIMVFIQIIYLKGRLNKRESGL